MNFWNIGVAIVFVGLFQITSGCSLPEEDTLNKASNYDEYDPTLNKQIKKTKTAFDLKQ